MGPGMWVGDAVADDGGQGFEGLLDAGDAVLFHVEAVAGRGAAGGGWARKKRKKLTRVTIGSEDFAARP